MFRLLVVTAAMSPIAATVLLAGHQSMAADPLSANVVPAGVAFESRSASMVATTTPPATTPIATTPPATTPIATDPPETDPPDGSPQSPPPSGGHAESPSPGCAGGWSAENLNAVLGGRPTGPDGLLGMDYARVQPLPDGRVLWVFQDVFLADAHPLGTLRDAHFVHNAGLVQDGACFHVLTGADGSRQNPQSWIGGETEVRLRSWLWPLDSVVTVDGDLAQFMVEMSNPNETGAAEGAVPVGVWIAMIDLPDLVVTQLQPAPDASDRPLYGFSITSDDDFTYLYGNCYRQFSDRGFVGLHDTSCGPEMYVARVPRGRPDIVPQHWDGRAWAADRSRATPMITRGDMANPMQIRRMIHTFVSVTKLDDWWGSEVVVDISDSPTGPWREILRIHPEPVCSDCNTYFAHLLPWTGADGVWLVVLSNNAWNFADANRDPALYRPSVIEVRPDQTVLANVEG